MASANDEELVPGVLLERLAQPDPARRQAALAGLSALLEEQKALMNLRPLPSGNSPRDLERPEVRAWDWGAFLAGPLWAAAHRMPLLALGLVLLFWLFPLVNVLLGYFGGAMAWRQRRFESVEEFARVQRAWMPAGVALFLAQLAILAGAFWLLLRPA